MGEQEKLKIFDEKKVQIGVATRSDVHRLGYWHEAFHCWFVGQEEGIDYIYFQLRSNKKKDYPNLFDITAAGHLLAEETVEDGVREIQEELGIDVAFEELIPLGVLNYCVIKENFIDKEIAYVYLYRSNVTFDDFTLQVEEVSGIVKAKMRDFSELWLCEKDEIMVSGFEVTDSGERVSLGKSISREDFVPHEMEFYRELILRLKQS